MHFSFRLQDPASGDAVDIVEGAPDYITGGPHVKAEAPDVPQATGGEPAGSRGRNGGKAGGSSGSRPAAEQGGTRGSKKRPAPSSGRGTGNQPRAVGGRFAPKQQASWQAAHAADLATTDAQQRGGRGGRHPRSAAVAAAGFAAAAAAANKGGLRRKAPPGIPMYLNSLPCPLIPARWFVRLRGHVLWCEAVREGFYLSCRARRRSQGSAADTATAGGCCAVATCGKERSTPGCRHILLQTAYQMPHINYAEQRSARSISFSRISTFSLATAAVQLV